MLATDDRGRTAPSRDGEDGAFEELVREHQRMIHSLCYRMTGSAEDAEDLAQETFVQAYRHLEGFRAEARITGTGGSGRTKRWARRRVAPGLCRKP
jgi:RNA polymerase sigma-70 factor (ECF subfamily)